MVDKHTSKHFKATFRKILEFLLVLFFPWNSLLPTQNTKTQL